VNHAKRPQYAENVKNTYVSIMVLLAGIASNARDATGNSPASAERRMRSARHWRAVAMSKQNASNFIPGNIFNVYQYCDGGECSLYQLVKKEPEWACSRIREGEKAEARLKELEAEKKRLIRNDNIKYEALHEIYTKACQAMGEDDDLYLYQFAVDVRDISLKAAGTKKPHEGA
jgi:hypothetical protein